MTNRLKPVPQAAIMIAGETGFFAAQRIYEFVV
jgi:hypothetical protein